MTTVERITDHVRQLPPDLQERVLSFTLALAEQPSPLIQGARIEDLMKFAGTIPSEDLKEMEKAIDEGCEQVNPNGW